MKVKPHNEAARAEYFDTVRRRLLDIPWQERQTLLSELVGRLDALPARANPTAVLGDGERYATLMRESAGYGRVPPKRFAYVRAWRRRRKILVTMSILLAVTVVPAGAIALRWREHYQPLRASTFGAGTTSQIVDVAAPTNTTWFRYRNGARVVLDGELVNTGRATVTVTGYLVPHDPYGPLVPYQLRVTRDPNNIAEWQKAAPAQRIVVRPGEHLTLFVLMKMVPWNLDAGSYVSQALPTFSVEVMGEHHALTMSGEAIGVVGPS